MITVAPCLCSRLLLISLMLSVFPSMVAASVMITDENGKKVPEVIGPINEGSHLSLVCETDGDVPSVVTWWKGPFLLDNTYATMPEGGVRNELVVSSLHRNDYMAAFTCQASLPNITKPSEASVSVDLNLSPLDVHITSLQRPLSAGHEVKLVCQSRGSKPPAVLTWWLGSRYLMNAENTSFNSISASTLSYVPNIDDQGRILSCRASNPMLNSSILEDYWVLNVYYVPQLVVTVGTVHPNIKEGDDVYFDCNIQANPSVTQVGWKFNSKTLYNNHLSSSVKVNNQSLLLQKVSRKNAGNYSCIAANVEGESTSESVYLDVQYVPSCLPNQKFSYGVPLHKSVEVMCSVEANPEDVTFEWHWNNSLTQVPLKQFSTNGTVSTILFTPKKKTDYGHLYCLARNIVGHQKEACCYKISPASVPSAVVNCAVENETLTSIHISCEPGFDGGLSQIFHLELYSMKGLQAMVSNKEMPVFNVTDLPSSVSYMGVIYATNSLGRSNSVAISASTRPYPTQKEAAKHMLISPILGTLIIVIGSLVLIAVVIVVGIRHEDVHVHEREERPVPPLPPENPSYPYEVRREIGELKPGQYM